MEPAVDRAKGCLLGLALGDALGAPYEGGVLERLLWSVIGRTRAGHRRWTDDTRMALDLAESLIENADIAPDDVARRFAHSYHWSRGYGPGSAKLLKRIARGADWRDANRSVYPDGSFGNGGAMRAPVLGVFYAPRLGALPDAARAAACVTHAHPLGLEGAVFVAAATSGALLTTAPLEILEFAATFCREPTFLERVAVAREWLLARHPPSAKEVRVRLGAGIAAAESCVTAVYTAALFLRQPFSELLAFVRACGGDVDTIGAMSGAVWGAANGASGLPSRLLDRLEARTQIETVAEALHAVSMAATREPESAPSLASR